MPRSLPSSSTPRNTSTPATTPKSSGASSRARMTTAMKPSARVRRNAALDHTTPARVARPTEADPAAASCPLITANLPSPGRRPGEGEPYYGAMGGDGRLRVLALIDNMGCGGAELLLSEFAREAPGAGIDLSVVYLTARDGEEAADRLRGGGGGAAPRAPGARR